MRVNRLLACIGMRWGYGVGMRIRRKPRHKIAGVWHWDGTDWHKGEKPTLEPKPVDPSTQAAREAGKRGAETRARKRGIVRNG